MGIRSDIRNVVRLGDAFSENKILNKEPQRNYLFEVHVKDSALGTSINDLKYYVKLVDLPTQTKDPIFLDFMDSRITFSGKDSSPHTFSITFWEDQSMTIYDYMQKWYQLTGTFKYNEGIQKHTYIKNIEVRLKDNTDLLTTAKFTFVNCFPIELGSTSLNYDDSSVLELPYVFSYDYIDFGDSEENIKDLQNFAGYFGL